MIQNAIRRLVRYGLQTGLVEKEDEIYTTNRLIELFGLDSPEVQGEQAGGAIQNGAEVSGKQMDGAAENGAEASGKQADGAAEEVSVDTADETGNLEEILKEMLDYAAEK